MGSIWSKMVNFRILLFSIGHCSQRDNTLFIGHFWGVPVHQQAVSDTNDDCQVASVLVRDGGRYMGKNPKWLL